MSAIELIYYIATFVSLSYVLKCISELRDAIKILKENQTVIKDAVNSLTDAMKAQHEINREHAVIFGRIFNDEPK
jgi:hypothetical protein